MSRYIDAEKIGLTNFEIFMRNGSSKEALKMLLDKIENAPTADVEEVKRGEWLRHSNDECKCSICDKIYRILDVCLKPFKYCPNCGAKMK